ncbi:kinase [Halobacillus sp. K22]|uniref:kinase n=1 Tax=Halobacillus sp. K22 TaxID=3457431 RepID=UPI003FCE78E7
MKHDLFDIIPSLMSNQLYLIGVDGLSRSGKTTFVEQLERELRNKGVNFQTFHMDDLIVRENERYHTGAEEWYEYYHLQWEAEWLSVHLFEKAKYCGRVTLPYYDKESDDHEYQTVDLHEEGVILVEGVFLQRKEWQHYFDYVIFLDCARARRFSREKPSAQKNMEKFKNRYWKAEDHYLRNVKPHNSADCIVKT